MSQVFSCSTDAATLRVNRHCVTTRFRATRCTAVQNDFTEAAVTIGRTLCNWALPPAELSSRALRLFQKPTAAHRSCKIFFSLYSSKIKHTFHLTASNGPASGFSAGEGKQRRGRRVVLSGGIRSQALRRIPSLLQSAEADYAALNLHGCGDTCHIRLGGKGKRLARGFVGLCKHFMLLFYFCPLPLPSSSSSSHTWHCGKQQGRTQESTLPFPLPLPEASRLSLSLSNKSFFSFFFCFLFVLNPQMCLSLCRPPVSHHIMSICRAMCGNATQSSRLFPCSFMLLKVVKLKQSTYALAKCASVLLFNDSREASICDVKICSTKSQ